MADRLVNAIGELVGQTNACLCSHPGEDHPEYERCVGYHAGDIDCTCEEWNPVVPARDVLLLLGPTAAPA